VPIFLINFFKLATSCPSGQCNGTPLMRLKLGNTFMPSGSYENDMKLVLPFYKGVVGNIPERSYQVE